MQLSPLDQPGDFEPHSCVDEVVEVAVRVLEGECIGVDELLGD
jgi:hypothetical protein